MVLWKIAVLQLCLQGMDSGLVPESAILPNMEEFCPDVDVCVTRRMLHKRGLGLPPVSQLVACCTACSCDDACVETNDCCFPPTGLHPDKECLYPTTNQDLGTLKKRYVSYRMVTTNRENPSENVEFTNSHKAEANRSCGEELYPLVGSLLPVYSPHNRTIYKNPACAESHGVTDGIIWRPQIVCPWADELTASRLASALEYAFVPTFCYINYEYPVQKTDLQPHVCYRDQTRTCPKQPFHVPERLNISADKVRALCNSGFLSPGYNRDAYANVFCHICNEASITWIYSGSRHCQDRSRWSLDPLDKDAFTHLLNTQTFDKSKSASRNDVIVPVACVNSALKSSESLGIKDNDRCREVKCPRSHVRTAEGHCDVLNNDLIGGLTYASMLKIRVDGILNPYQENFRQTIEDLTDIWRRQEIWAGPFDVLCEYEEDSANTTRIKNLYVRTLLPQRPFHTLLKGVKASLNKTLTVNETGVMTILDQEFADFVQYAIKRDTIHGYRVVVPKQFASAKQDSLEDLGIFVPTMFRVLSQITDYGLNRNIFYINKLHYCEQIELNEHEVSSYTSNSLNTREDKSWLRGGGIRNDLTQKLLFENEFWTVDKPNGEAIVRVCLEDSGFIKAVQKSGSIRIERSWAVLLACGGIFFQHMY